ncbi:hypothetical protein B0O40_1160 [Ruminococcaceae bacterium R-25]|nr:hypothetical protein B0O40_1160 [Ruminococcaceae bacterium R-25]SUQ11771.1 hypothetical protein SAMN06297423_1160 [Oscillospiraceae bacterium]
MKKISTFITAVFFLMAAALGWFIPLATFNVEDKLAEGKHQKLDIEKINLSYRDDLAMNQKINIVSYEYMISSSIELDKGVFNQKEDIDRIMTEFMTDFTGLRFSAAYGANSKPVLLNLANNRGTIVIWVVDCLISENWSIQCYVDDRTGAILHCEMYGNPDAWSSFVEGSQTYSDPAKSIAERYSNALYNHYQRQLSAKLVTYHMVLEQPLDMSVGYRLVFRDAKNYTFQVTVNVGYYNGTIEAF